jgi:hypothetical protein
MNNTTKRILFFSITALLLMLFANQAGAQCSICTKTASQLGDGPAKALNGAILYLAGAPLAIMGYIGWRWYKTEQKFNAGDTQTKTNA